MELSQFIYGLLSRSRKSSSLPPLNSWEHYMDVSKVADIENLSCDDFLLNYEFGSVLRGIKGGEAREFRRQCPDFIDRFVEIILVQYPASSDFAGYIYCFCPELLLEGGDEYIFGLFNCLVALLKRCKVLTDVEAGAATEEFLSFVVDVRARHDTGAQHAEEIPDLVAFLLADYSFLARKCLCRVFKLFGSCKTSTRFPCCWYRFVRLYCAEARSVILYPWCPELCAVTKIQTESLLYQAHYGMYSRCHRQFIFFYVVFWVWSLGQDLQWWAKWLCQSLYVIVRCLCCAQKGWNVPSTSCCKQTWWSSSVY